MAKKITSVISFLFISGAVLLGFLQSAPQDIKGLDAPKDEFSTARAFQHVESMSEWPHYIGSPQHNKVRNYLISELQEMGLFVEMQQTYALNNTGVLAQPQNILARIEGSGEGKALLLLSHYDSAVHSSFGASDAASGVATILEGLRAYLASGMTPVNDIIVMFSDAEEVGLNGAEAFVDQHRWAGDVGLALNFESRGSGGDSFMLIETNSGNEELIEHFIRADVSFPVANSLAYSVYKMLPNDTDLTVLREQEDISGFNFAFIGDHFDYHTATDVAENLDKESLAHQGSYLMPLLDYFSRVPLENLASEDELIYFNVPLLDMLSYPFSFSLPLLIAAILIFCGLLYYGFSRKKISFTSIWSGFVALFLTIIASGLLTYALWELALLIYPQYREIEHGFTYNGYYYIAAVIFLSLAICFFCYQKLIKTSKPADSLIAALFIWIILSAGATFYLQGAAYFIIPVFFGLLQLFILLRWQRPHLLLLTVLSLPAIFIVQPFIVSFPVALGLKMLFLSAVLVALLWTLIAPIFKMIGKLEVLGLFFLVVFVVLIFLADEKAEFNPERPKPNSLVYVLDKDDTTATWNTYDKFMDSWTHPFFDEDAKKTPLEVLFSSKYGTGFTKTAQAPIVDIPEPFIQVEQLRDSAGYTKFSVKVAPNRKINRLELFTEKKIDFEHFTVNGEQAETITSAPNSPHIFKNRWSKRLLTYYAANRDTLRLKFSVEEEKIPDLVLYETSYDLLENEALAVPPRSAEMIPRPFVLNDAVVLKKTIKLD